MPFRIDLSLVERAEHPADIFYIRTTTRQEEEKDGSITEKEIHEVVVDTFILWRTNTRDFSREIQCAFFKSGIYKSSVSLTNSDFPG